VRSTICTTIAFFPVCIIGVSFCFCRSGGRSYGVLCVSMWHRIHVLYSFSVSASASVSASVCECEWEWEWGRVCVGGCVDWCGV